MANELVLSPVPTLTDATVYAVLYNASGQVYNGSTFVSPSDATRSAEGVAMPETPSGSGSYIGSFPTAITTAGVYTAFVYRQASGSPSTSDTEVGYGNIDWNGSGEVTPPTGTNLISLAYAKTFLPSYVQSVTTYDANIGYMIADATAAIQGYCNRVFSVADYAESYSLDNPLYSMLLRQYPVISISQITLYPNFDNPTVIPGAAFSCNASNGQIALKPSYAYPPYFPEGFQSVLAEYQAGYSVIPNDLQRAAAMAVQNIFAQQGINATLTMEKTQTYQYQRQPAFVNVILTDNVKEILNPYKRWTI